MKYPIGIQSFESLREDGFVYVDKTALIYDMVQQGKVYFLSRPRRFGKSLLVSVLENYFLGRRELFEGLEMERLEKEWKRYPVFHVDFNLGNNRNIGSLDEALNLSLRKWERLYGVECEAQDYGRRFCAILEAAHAQTGLRCVVLVDEYDKPLLDVMDMGIQVDSQGQSVSLETYNREMLRAFYSTFKSADPHLKFVLLTGVTKFSQVSVFSGFNQPDDISMNPKYDALCGITDEEIDAYFSDAVQEMAQSYGIGEQQMRQMLKQRFNGYHFSRSLKGVYNPFSLLSTFKSGVMSDYWFSTGTPSYLIRLLRHFNENMDELTSRYYEPQEFVDYKADVERPLPMIYQSGYLTIKDYDPDMQLFRLDYPNDEVKRGFVTLLANNYLDSAQSANSWVVTAVMALKQGRLDDFRRQLTSFFASIPYSMRRKENERERERYFHYTFYLLMRLASTYVTHTEQQQSQGRADCVIETDRHVYIFEFKLDSSASEALQQIEAQGYARPYASDSRQVHCIGVSFSSETGTVNDWAVSEAAS